MQAETPDRILRINTVLDRTGLSRSTMYRKMENGTFPKNVQISTRCVGWRESAIIEWLRNPVFYQVSKELLKADASHQTGRRRLRDRVDRQNTPKRLATT